MSDHTEKWKTIVILQQATKRLYIIAEEMELDHKSYIQPLLELRSALDHICRASAQSIKLISKKENYSEVNMDKAVGHLYRAYFDTADWISIIIRERIYKLLKPYNTEIISTVLSDYYSSIKPNLDRITDDIARLRGAKDIAEDSKVTETVAAYNKRIDELIYEHRKIELRKSDLRKYKLEKYKSKLGKMLWQLILVVIGFLLGYFLNNN